MSRFPEYTIESANRLTEAPLDDQLSAFAWRDRRDWS
jgi:hypothetical protein